MMHRSRYVHYPYLVGIPVKVGDIVVAQVFANEHEFLVKGMIIDDLGSGKKFNIFVHSWKLTFRYVGTSLDYDRVDSTRREKRQKKNLPIGNNSENENDWISVVKVKKFQIIKIIHEHKKSIINRSLTHKNMGLIFSSAHCILHVAGYLLLCSCIGTFENMKRMSSNVDVGYVLNVIILIVMIFSIVYPYADEFVKLIRGKITDPSAGAEFES